MPLLCWTLGQSEGVWFASPIPKGAIVGHSISRHGAMTSHRKQCGTGSVVKPSEKFFFKKFFFLLGNSLLGNTFFY